MDDTGTSSPGTEIGPGTSPSSTREGHPLGAKAKGKGRERDTHGYGSSPIQNLPLECLAHIFANLPPRELGTCQLVCRAWNAVVDDEASWRTAFETYYGVTADSLGRRIEPASWRAEYITRVALMRQWHRSRTPTVGHNPSLGAISSIHIQLPAISPPVISRSTNPAPPRRDSITPTDLTLLSASLPLGAAVHSIPFTGKLSKRPLLSSPIDHLGRPIGLPIVGVTSFAVSNDGTRLLWGMRDGSIRLSNSAPSGGRGAVGSTIDQGEVRQVPEAHREGTAVQLVSFSNVAGLGGGRVSTTVQHRSDAFVTVGKDGIVAVWTLNVPPVPGARERAPPAAKIWSARWDVQVDQVVAASSATSTGPTAAEVARSRVKATAIAFDGGRLGRHRGRLAGIAIGRSDGKVVVWPELDLPEGPGLETIPVEPVVISSEDKGRIETLVFDAPFKATSPRSLLVHAAGFKSFSKYTFTPFGLASDSILQSPKRTVFGHAEQDELAALTCLAVDFDEPPPLPQPSHPATPSGDPATISLVPPRLSSLASSATLPPLSRTNSELTLPSTTSAALDAEFGANRFGRKKYVVGGDKLGRVFLWDWSGEPQDEGQVVGPAKVLQGLETEGGGSASKITALEVTEAGIFVGGLDGTLRFYSSLGPASTPQPPIRVFRDRSAGRHPSRMLAQGLVSTDDEEKWLVSHIRANRECVVAAVGGRILAWRTEAIVKKKVGLGKGGKVTARQERFKANIELQHQVRESISALSAESTARIERFEEENRLSTQFGLPPTLDNLTEEEAIAFAMMLSAEEEEKKLVAIANDNGKGRERDEGSDEEWEQPPDEWLADDGVWLDEDYDSHQPLRANGRPSASGLHEFDSDYGDSPSTSRRQSNGQSPSTSLTIPSSPFLRGSSVPNGSPSPSPRSFSAYSWKPASATSSPLLSALGTPPANANAKLQISPRLGPTYGSSFANYSNDPVPDMDPALWPAASTSTSPPLPASRKSSMASPLGSAAPSPAVTTSPSLPSSTSDATIPPTTTPLRRNWSQIAQSSSSPSPTPSPGPSHAQFVSPPPPPPRSPWSSSKPAPSLLAEQLRSQASSKTVAEQEEDRRRRREEEDLRFAIEMSLAEETSRLEI
ncbi:hypothetical protein JCM10212_003075 [Sporobolomyces blumeae]